MSDASPDVVLIEDDDALRMGTAQGLALEGMRVAPFADARSALATINPLFPGVIVSDIRMAGMDGLQFFEKALELDPEMQVIFTTAHGDVELAVGAMKKGAADFFPKPYSIARLAHSIRRAAEKRALTLEIRNLRAELSTRPTGAMLGRSQAAIRLERITREAARAETDLLLRGEPGVGKSFLARQIHELSPRANRPFVVIDPGIFANEEADLLLYGRDPSVALSRSGMIERANGGTLVLEAIEQLPERAAARLVSLVDNRAFHALGSDRPKRVDIRIIATTSDMASEKTRERSTERAGLAALTARLGGITIGLPPLRERREDIPEFFRSYLAEYERQLGRQETRISETDWQHLLTYEWPDNLRELKMFAQNLVIGLTHLIPPPPDGEAGRSLRAMVERFEKTILQDALRAAGGNVKTVQRNLAVPRKTLYDKFARHDLRPGDFRDP